MGATRARLVPDPERGPWVTRIFEWRVYEMLSADTIAQRLHQQGAPSKDGKPWTPGAVYSILRNPKYTGRVVIGRTRNSGTGKRAGERKMRHVPREHWTWADDANAHPALISMELWEAAQTIGRQRGNVQDHQDQRPNGRADYPLRARIRCAQCNRRMCGHLVPGRAPGKEYYYYVCPHNPNNPRDHQQHPEHVRAAVRERVIHGAIDSLLTTLLSRDRREALAAILPATAAEHDQQAAARAEVLRRQLAQNETAQNGLITQLERLGGDTSPAAEAMRQRITGQFTDRYNQARDLRAQLDDIQAAQPPPKTPPCSTSCLTSLTPSPTHPTTSRPSSTPRSASRSSTAPTRTRPPSGPPSPTPHPASSPPSPTIPAPTTTPRMETWQTPYRDVASFHMPG